MEGIGIDRAGRTLTGTVLCVSQGNSEVRRSSKRIKCELHLLRPADGAGRRVVFAESVRLPGNAVFEAE